MDGGLDLLASAIAGRSLEVAAVAPGEPPWTDGAVVYVDPSAALRDRVRAVVVQAALLAAGSLDPAVVGGLGGLGGLGRHGGLGGPARRYLVIEGHRALAAQAAVLPPAVGGLVDPAIAALSDSPAVSLGLATGRTPLADPPPEFGVLRPRQLRVRAAALARADGAERRHVPRSADRREQVLRELDDGEDAERAGAFDLFDPVGGGGAVGRLLQRLLGNARSKGGGQPGAEAPTHATAAGGRRTRGAAVSTTRVALPGDVEGLRQQGVTYPEWNVHERRYRPGWCTVTTSPPDVAGEGGGEVGAPEVPALRRALGRLGLDLERRRRRPQGDEVDIDAVVEARVALAAGCPPREAVYVESVRRRRELSVLVLLDVSGSAGEPGVTGARVHEHQVRAAAGLTTALHDLGDRVALYGFRSSGRRAVQVLPVKRFGDGLDAAVLRRLGALVPGAYTRLGAAIRHGAAVLEADGGTARRLLVVLSDGFAYDHGYEGPYGEADARRALAEARRRGTACLCLSVGADTDAAALRRVFGTAAHALVPDVRRLPAVVGPLFRSALRLAEQQRRSAQRRHRTRARLRLTAGAGAATDENDGERRPG